MTPIGNLEKFKHMETKVVYHTYHSRDRVIDILCIFGTGDLTEYLTSQLMFYQSYVHVVKLLKHLMTTQISIKCIFLFA